jgi:exopolysaccharide biosynthesis protein
MRINLLLLSLTATLMAGDPGNWRSLAPGLDLGTFVTERKCSIGDSRITVLRIDPNLWDLQLAGLSQTGESEGRTAREWCQKYNFTAVINAGMYDADFLTHVGFLQNQGHVNNNEVNDYKSVAAFDPIKGKQVPRFRIFDLDEVGVTMATILKDYASAVQNLRLIKRPGLNRWSQADKRWSEAALGEDKEGRVLFIFTRSPYTMYDLNRELIAMGIGLLAAQHLEGGPEAQIYIHVGNEELEMFGSYETSFRESDNNTSPWPIPNILGIKRR